MIKQGNLIRFFNSERATFILVSVVFYIFCIYEYKVFVFENYEYMGFKYEPSLIKMGFSFLIYCTSFFYLFLRNSFFIRGISSLLHILFLLPNLVMFQFMQMDVTFIICSLLLLVLINFNRVVISLPRPPLFIEKQKSLVVALITLVCLIPFFLTYRVNLDPALFSMGEELYSVRAGLKGVGNVFTSYLLTPLSQVLLPVLVIYGLKEKHFNVAIFGVMATMILFLMLPHKSIFFGIIVMLFFYFFHHPLKKVLVFTFLLVFLMTLGKISVIYADNFMIESLLLRRYLLLPSLLNISYFDFFENTPLYFSYSFLSNFIEYPYNVGPTFLIGDYLFGNINTNANNGFLSDGYINLGYLGIYLFTVIVAFIFKLIDGFNIDPKYFGLFFLLINLFRSSGLSTSLLTHGTWLLILICYLLLARPRNSAASKEFESVLSRA